MDIFDDINEDNEEEGMFDSADVIRRGTRFNTGFNIAMIFFETIAVLIILASPILVGYLAWTWFPVAWEASKDSAWVFLFFFVVGLPVLTAYIMGGVGIYSVVSAFLSTIKSSLDIIRDRSK